MDKTEADLVIVGAGIAGPALAARLRHTGWRIVLVERSDRGIDTARGDHLQARVVATLAEWGALDAITNAGAEVREGIKYRTPEGDEIFTGPIRDLDISHPYSLFLNHERISETLIKVAAENPNFTLMCPATVKDVEQTVEGSGRVEVLVDGKKVELHTAAIAGADGRGSLTRRKLGIDAELHDFNNPLAITFAPHPCLEPGNYIVSYLCGAESISVIPRTGGHAKIGVPVTPKDIPFWKKSKPSVIRDWLAARVPVLRNIEPEPIHFYPVQRVTASRWTQGNAVLLGDACHAMHPARSQGMNISIRAIDALARHIEHHVSAPYSDSFSKAFAAYDAEIRPALAPVLEKNNQYGLAMDAMDPNVIRDFEERLRAANADPNLKHQMIMEQAGYTGP